MLGQRQQVKGVVVEDGGEEGPVAGADEFVVELGDHFAGAVAAADVLFQRLQATVRQ
jgi:hypothetical protein